MELYPTDKTVSGRAGLHGRRYQSDTTDLQGGMARGEPFMRDALMKAARCVIMPQGAFHSWGEARRTLGWDEKKIIAAMANRLCGIIHTMLMKAQSPLLSMALRRGRSMPYVRLGDRPPINQSGSTTGHAQRREHDATMMRTDKAQHNHEDCPKRGRGDSVAPLLRLANPMKV